MPSKRLQSRNARLARIAEAYLDVAWRVAKRCGVPDSELDDVVQEVFIVVCRRLDQIPSDRERAYVAGITVRLAANFRRSRLRRRLDPSTDVDAVVVPGESAIQELDIARRQGLQFLDEVLARMTDGQREVFVLTELEQLTARQVGEQLGIDEAAVVSRLRRARELFDSCRARRRAADDGRMHPKTGGITRA